MNFDQAFDLLLSPSHEGGYVNDPSDPGGETKFGISKRSYPHLDIPNLTREKVRPIYMFDFWGKAGCSAVHPLLKFPLFDFAVNSGVSQAVKTLQRLVDARPDGLFGPETLRKTSERDPFFLALEYQLERLQFMTDLANWRAHGRGWAKRIRTNMLITLAEAKRS